MCTVEAGANTMNGSIEGFYNVVLGGDVWVNVSKSMWYRQIAGV